MFEIARYDGRKRLKGALAMSVGIALLTALYVAMFPSITEAANLDDIINSYPPAMREAFGIRTMNTIEGFLATQLYAFAWVILLGLYFAYAAASLVAGDVETEKMDMTLSLPVSRSQVLLEKFASLAVPLVVANALLPVVVFVGTLAIGEEIAMVDVLAAHALSIPYLLACAGIGIVASVVFDRASIAQRVAVGIVFAMFLVDAVVADTSLAALGYLAPMHYYDPAAILVDSSYDLVGAGILLAATVVLVLVSREFFRRKDIA
ncbi:ABC transporter permease [Haloarchaeobius amylolyticus]|uniref:ABC transporter permease n=1 Tax=Haloarchaeobius amylolyticus TaxID=1198296 RepID=UPI00226E726F|nr:ABC transporter permease subunit [Haloarchaeobius amylolyticus]